MCLLSCVLCHVCSCVFCLVIYVLCLVTCDLCLVSQAHLPAQLASVVYVYMTRDMMWGTEAAAKLAVSVMMEHGREGGAALTTVVLESQVTLLQFVFIRRLSHSLPSSDPLFLSLPLSLPLSPAP